MFVACLQHWFSLLLELREGCFFASVPCPGRTGGWCETTLPYRDNCLFLFFFMQFNDADEMLVLETHN